MSRKSAQPGGTGAVSASFIQRGSSSSAGIGSLELWVPAICRLFRNEWLALFGRMRLRCRDIVGAYVAPEVTVTSWSPGAMISGKLTTTCPHGMSR